METGMRSSRSLSRLAIELGDPSSPMGCSTRHDLALVLSGREKKLEDASPREFAPADTMAQGKQRGGGGEERGDDGETSSR